MADAAVTAGRGIIYIALAKAYFMVAGYAITFVLSKLVFDSAQWGDYGVVIAWVSVIDNVIVAGTVQGVSRYTVQSDDSVDSVKRTALRIQLLLGGGIALAYCLGAPLVAKIQRDASLVGCFRLSAGVIFCYSLYAVFIGSLNGQRLFFRQALFDVAFATLRGALIVGFAAAGYGVFGAIGGFTSAAALILIAAAWSVGLPARGTQPFDRRVLLGFIARLFVYTGALNLLMRVDLFIVKGFVIDLVGDVADPVTAGKVFTGYYFSAQTLALIPFQASMAVAFVVFPLLSRATFEQDAQKTQSYVRQTLRLSLVFVAGLAVVFVASPSAVIGVLYAEAQRQAAGALQVLAVAMVMFSLLSIVNTILNAAGFTRATITTTVFTMLLSAIANWLLVSSAPSAAVALIYASSATAAAVAVGLCLALYLLHRTFGAGLPLRSALRVLFAAGCACAVGRLLPEVSKVVTLAECLAVLLVYLVALMMTGELGAEDRGRVMRILGRGR